MKVFLKIWAGAKLYRDSTKDLRNLPQLRALAGPAMIV